MTKERATPCDASTPTPRASSGFFGAGSAERSGLITSEPVGFPPGVVGAELAARAVVAAHSSSSTRAPMPDELQQAVHGLNELAIRAEQLAGHYRRTQRPADASRSANEANQYRRVAEWLERITSKRG